MTTITFDQNLETLKTHYHDINELIEELEDTAFGNIISQNNDEETFGITELRTKFQGK